MRWISFLHIIAYKTSYLCNYLQQNQFIKQQPGFYYRSLIKESDEQFLDIVYWESEEKAKAAGEKFMAQPWAEQMMSLIDVTSINMRHVQSMSEIGYDSE